MVTWAVQDQWEDPRGPLGVDKASPKLAPLTSDSPEWLRNLHHNGVIFLCAFLLKRQPR